MESEFGSDLSHDIGKVLCSSDTADLEVFLPKTPAAQTSLHEHWGFLGTMCPVCSAPFILGLPCSLTTLAILVILHPRGEILPQFTDHDPP